MATDNSLDAIAIRHGTDKSSNGGHNYMRVYERYFMRLRYDPLVLMEFGVDKGASIRTWLEYFLNASVVGVDIVDCPPIDNPRYRFFKGAITDAELWKALPHCDILIDDNGHAGNEAVTAIKWGMLKLNPGGLLIIEDLHTCYDQHFTPAGGPNPLNYLRQLVDAVNDNGRGQCGDNRDDDCPIEFIHFYKSIVIIGKRA